MSDPVIAQIETIIKEKAWIGLVGANAGKITDAREAARAIAALIAEAREAGRREGMEEAARALERWRRPPDGYVFTREAEAIIRGWSDCSTAMFKTLRALAKEPPRDR